MAEKRITTVDEVMTVDENADFVLISRGVQRDLKRLLVRRFPQGFDLHDHVTDRLTTLAGIDRLLVADEGSPGAPQKYVTLSTLRSFLLDLFDLHDDVPNELTGAADEDRLLISDESEAGDPQKFISLSNLKKYIDAPAFVTLDMPLASWPAGSGNFAATLNHTLGAAPKFIELAHVECVQAISTYSVGDRLYPSYTGGRRYGLENGLTLNWSTATANSIQYRMASAYSPAWSIKVGAGLAGNNNTYTVSGSNRSSWKAVWALWG